MATKGRTIHWKWQLYRDAGVATALAAATGAGMSALAFINGTSLVVPVLGTALAASLSYMSFDTGHSIFRRVQRSLQSNDENNNGIPDHLEEGLPKRMANDNEIVRLLNVVSNVSKELMPDYDQFVKKDKELVEFAFHATRPGLFATGTLATTLISTIRTAMGDHWQVSIDPRTDAVTATANDELPSIALPEMWPVVATKEEAAEKFSDLKIYLGVSEVGPLSYTPETTPHIEVVGATGGGKSVAVRGQLMQYLSAGYRLFLCDGKGTDYASLRTMPNVSAVSSTLGEHVAVIHMVSEILANRRAVASQMAAKGDNSWRKTMYPVLLVLDEWASVKLAMEGEYPTKDVNRVLSEIAILLKVGREFRVNVLLATQDMKAKTVPSDWLEQFKVVQALGRPSGMAISKAFPAQEQANVTLIGQQISPKARGRALVTLAGDDGSYTTRLYQSYFSYTPAEDMSTAHEIARRGTPEIVSNWENFDRMVVQQIPHLYPRVWVRMEYPEGKYDRPDEWVNLDAIPPISVLSMPVIEVSDIHGHTLPGLEESDPAHDRYVGTKSLDLTGDSSTMVI